MGESLTFLIQIVFVLNVVMCYMAENADRVSAGMILNDYFHLHLPFYILCTQVL